MKIEIYLWPEIPNSRSLNISRGRDVNIKLETLERYENMYIIVYYEKKNRCWISNKTNIKRLEKCCGYKNIHHVGEV